MKLLVLTNNYYPLKTANEICFQNILDKMVDVDCSVVCFGDKETIVKQKNLAIYSIKGLTKRKINNIFLHYIFEFFIRTLSLFYRPSMKKNAVDAYVDKAVDIIKYDKPDIVISLLQPVASVESGYIIKKTYPEIKYVIYDLDTLSNCNFGVLENFPFLKRLYLKSVKKYEKKVFTEADLIIHLNCHKVHFSDSFYDAFSSKTLFLGIPVLNINKSFKKNANKDFVYAGRFYGKLRDPKILIDIFENVLRLNVNKFNIYTNDDYVKNINNLLAGKNIDIRDRFIVHSYVSQEKLDEIMDNIGFLVSLGNSYTDMFPSKIISYVGSLKPIIHIYQTPDDPVIEFLKKYPDALLINSKDSLEINSNKIIEFVNSERPVIEPEFIKEIYKENLPEYSANEIMSFLNMNKNSR